MKTNVQPPLEFIPPQFDSRVLQICQVAMPWWMRWQTPIQEIKSDRVEGLVDLYDQFQQQKVRFLLAFRHPSIDDPFSISQLLWKHVPAVAKQQGVCLKLPTHAHFMYDRGIPLWAGRPVEWLFPRLGGTSILRGKLDRQGLKSARDLFVNGQFPLAAAPEGATNGHNQQVSPLEPGMAQLGFWCVEDLYKAQRNETVLIVPLGVQYHYRQENWDAIAQLLTQMEIECGLSPTTVHPSPTALSLYPQLIRLANTLLELMENFYRQFYNQPIPQETPEDLPQRLQRLLDVALKVAEDYFAIKPKGNLTDRCRRLEQAGWDCIYRDDLKDIETLSNIERGLADRVAEEASLRMWHMRLVESFVAVSGSYVQEHPTFDRFAETTLILWRTIKRLSGNNPVSRPNLGVQGVKLTIGDPLCVSDRWSEYRQNRRQAIAYLTQDLQQSLTGLIQDFSCNSQS